jgi:hypothetical protein
MVTFFVKARAGIPQGGCPQLPSSVVSHAQLFHRWVFGRYVERKMGPKGRITLMQLYWLVFAIMTFLMTQIDWGRLHGLRDCLPCWSGRLHRLSLGVSSDGCLRGGAEILGGPLSLCSFPLSRVLSALR